MRKAILSICIFCLAITTFAQEVKFGKVSKSEIVESAYPKDSSVVAAYLYKSKNSYFEYGKGSGLMLITVVHERIKIYDTDGLEYANHSVNLYKNGSSEEGISQIKGIVYNSVNGNIEETKLKKESIIREEKSDYLKKVKITFPNVREGSVVEYRYRVTSPFISNIDEFVFQEEIPIKKLYASIRFLEYFQYRTVEKGSLTLNPQISSVMNPTLGVKAQKREYFLENVPALKAEKYVNNIGNYTSGVKFEIVSFNVPGQITEYYSKTWEDVAKTIFDSGDFGEQLKKSRYFAEELDALLDEENVPVNRMAMVYNFVKSKVKWNENYGKFAENGVKSSFDEGEGNDADINLMLVAMLRHAGIDSDPILVSTRNHGIPMFPTLNGFNYVIARAKIGENTYLLDATESFASPNILPLRALNWYGRSVKSNGSSEIVSLNSQAKAGDVAMMKIVINDDGSVDGKFRQQYNNHNALYFRKKYHSTNETSFIEELGKESNDIEIEEYEIKDINNPYLPVSHSYDFYGEDMVEFDQNSIYFLPMFQLTLNENPFKLEKRTYPVDFGYPWVDKRNVIVEIPDGYEVKSVPKSMALSLPNGIGSFKYMVNAQAKTISINCILSLNHSIVNSDMYSGLKEFFRQVVEKQTERVVLSKINGDGTSKSAAGGK